MEIELTVTSPLYFYPTVGVYNNTLIPHYGNVVDGDNYFTRSLRGSCWKEASQEEKVAALTDATRLIDALSFKGKKASDDQPLQFPRTITIRRRIVNTNCTEAVEVVQENVPASINAAAYEIALCLLDGYDPDLEIENLGSTSQGLGQVRDTFTRDFVLDHIRAGIPSAKAWASLRPYLIDANTVRVRRVD